MGVFVRRLGFYLVAAVAAITLDFFIPRLVPGDPGLTALGQVKGTVPPGALEAMERQYGATHASLWSQYVHFWHMLLHGDLGLSFSSGNQPVTSVIASHIWWTVLLVGVATTMSFVIGTLIGTLAACRRGTWIEAVLLATAVLHSMPYF